MQYFVGSVKIGQKMMFVIQCSAECEFQQRLGSLGVMCYHGERGQQAPLTSPGVSLFGIAEGEKM